MKPPKRLDDGTAIGRGYERGKKQIKQAFGETLGTIGEQSGLGFLANYGQGCRRTRSSRARRTAS